MRGDGLGGDSLQLGLVDLVSYTDDEDDDAGVFGHLRLVERPRLVHRRLAVRDHNGHVADFRPIAAAATENLRAHDAQSTGGVRPASFERCPVDGNVDVLPVDNNV